MATMITSECINCGACEPECPNTAIYQGGVEWDLNGEVHPPISEDIFYIVPQKCTECVGFYDHEACAAVCPVDCCVPNPEIVETEAELIGRAQQLHPETTFGEEFPSRFRTEGTAAPAPTQAQQTNGVAGQTNGATEPAPAPVAAPPPPPEPKPAAASAKAAPAPAVKPAVKPVAKPAPVPAPAKKVVTEKVFQGELAGSFEQVLTRIQPKQGNLVLGTILAVVQPIFGALPLSSKQTLERMLGDRRYFNTATATGLNVLLNMILYPAVFVAIYTTLLGGELFSQAVNTVIFLGLTLASIETVIRLRELFFYGLPIEEATFRGTWYGLFLAPLVALSLGFIGRHSPDKGQIAFDGYYAQEFDEKTERARRYGEIYTVEELGNAYLFRLELPRRIPVSAAKREMGISDEMPDYEYNLSIRDGGFVVRGSITDPQIRKLAAVSPAFPPDFTKRIDLKSPVTSFKHRYRDKTLEAVLFTQ